MFCHGDVGDLYLVSELRETLTRGLKIALVPQFGHLCYSTFSAILILTEEAQEPLRDQSQACCGKWGLGGVGEERIWRGKRHKTE